MQQRDWQSENAHSPRVDTFVPFSNVTFERCLQQAKQYLGMISTDDGMQIDPNEQEEKANSAKVTN
jgi:hypothetical protein